MNQLLVVILRIFTRTVKPQYLEKNHIYCTRILPAIESDFRFCVPFTTTPRWLSTRVSFEELDNLLTNQNILIIDVREPHELKETGVIPGSINIPLDNVRGALNNLSDGEFLAKYGRVKPNKYQIIVFICRTSVRSKDAQELAMQLGYKNTKFYAGGWNDWIKKKHKM